ncbi:hypothetical protein [Oceanotoga teriensis]|uniref:hypothetical protein n=1 Tax=Oceanotoga teriensis TaxID=515440 RepID=UPI002713669F|nr:hypothetical protein [Oceanotoga teriensis]MDO7977452.1 hypothetical protein [Oceanotoga teriensis]
MNLKKIIQIVEYSRFSKPFLNYIILDDALDEEIKLYIKLLFLKWDSKFDQSLKIINRELKKDHKTSIRALLLIEKSNCTNNKEEEKEIYYEMKEMLSKIPTYIRNIAIMNLKNTANKYPEFEVKNTRVWSYSYDKNYTFKAWILFSESNKMYNEGKVYEAYYKDMEAINYLKKISHPFGIISGLNNAIWRIRCENFSEIFNNLEEFQYYLGKYLEISLKNFIYFDTLIDVYVLKNNFNMYEIAYIVDNIVKKIKKDKRYDINKFQNILDLSKNISFTLNYQNKYSLSKNIIDFLKNLGKDNKYAGLSKSSYFNIINFNVDYITKNTVRKIIKNNKIKYNTKVPNVFISEIKKMKIEEKFKKNIKKFENMDRIKKIRGFLISYLSEESDYIFKTKIKYVFDEKFNLKKVDYRLMQIINRIFEEENSYYRGRKEITSKFINRIKENKLEKFMKNYQKLEFEEMEMMKKFIRNYGRYDIKTVKDEFYPKTCEEIDWFIQEYGLNPKLCGISVFAFDLNERKKFLNFMNEMKDKLI